MSGNPHRTRPHRRARRLSPVLLVVVLATALVGLVAPPAQAASKWNSGQSRYSTIVNCPSIIWGSPYQEYGIAGFNSYWGDQQSNPVSPRAGETTYLSTYVLLVGSHCSTPFIFPTFQLPNGVSFDKSQAIRCYYTPPGSQTQRQITHPAECPQWSNVAADGRYSSTQTNWHSGWPLPSGEGFVNGSGWEFVVPIRATTQQWGSQLRTKLELADGNSNAPLDLTVPFYTGPAPTYVPGQPRNVQASATAPTTARVSFDPPTSDGGAPITGYTARCESTNGGVTQTVNGNASPLDLTGLTPEKSYACDVRATNSVGAGSWSNKSIAFTTPRVTTAPGKPTAVSITPQSPKSASVAFTPPADDGGAAITSYRARCTSTDGGTARTLDGTTSPITFANLSPGKTYRCRVNATNAVGTSAYSSYSAAVSQPAGVPGRPTSVTGSAQSTTSARITFSAPADDGGAAITSYRVQCVSPNGGTSRTADGASSPVTVTRLTPGKGYRCRVKATNAAGTSGYSGYSPRFDLPA